MTSHYLNKCLCNNTMTECVTYLTPWCRKSELWIIFWICIVNYTINVLQIQNRASFFKLFFVTSWKNISIFSMFYYFYYLLLCELVEQTKYGFTDEKSFFHIYQPHHCIQYFCMVKQYYVSRYNLKINLIFTRIKFYCFACKRKMLFRISKCIKSNFAKWIHVIIM